MSAGDIYRFFRNRGLVPQRVQKFATNFKKLYIAFAHSQNVYVEINELRNTVAELRDVQDQLDIRLNKFEVHQKFNRKEVGKVLEWQSIVNGVKEEDVTNENFSCN